MVERNRDLVGPAIEGDGAAFLHGGLERGGGTACRRSVADHGCARSRLGLSLRRNIAGAHRDRAACRAARGLGPALASSCGSSSGSARAVGRASRSAFPASGSDDASVGTAGAWPFRTALAGEPTSSYGTSDCAVRADGRASGSTSRAASSDGASAGSGADGNTRSACRWASSDCEPSRAGYATRASQERAPGATASGRAGLAAGSGKDNAEAGRDDGDGCAMHVFPGDDSSCQR